MGLHAFRHCNASAHPQLGAPMRIRMDRLGHAQQETTMGYSHSNIGDHRRYSRPSWGSGFLPSIILCPG